MGSMSFRSDILPLTVVLSIARRKKSGIRLKSFLVFVGVIVLAILISPLNLFFLTSQLQWIGHSSIHSCSKTSSWHRHEVISCVRWGHCSCYEVIVLANTLISPLNFNQYGTNRRKSLARYIRLERDHKNKNRKQHLHTAKVIWNEYYPPPW